MPIITSRSPTVEIRSKITTPPDEALDNPTNPNQYIENVQIITAILLMVFGLLLLLCVIDWFVVVIIIELRHKTRGKHNKKVSQKQLTRPNKCDTLIT
jgi:hypothetical protein